MKPEMWYLLTSHTSIFTHFPFPAQRKNVNVLKLKESWIYATFIQLGFVRLPFSLQWKVQNNVFRSCGFFGMVASVKRALGFRASLPRSDSQNILAVVVKGQLSRSSLAPLMRKLCQILLNCRKSIDGWRFRGIWTLNLNFEISSWWLWNYEIAIMS